MTLVAGERSYRAPGEAWLQSVSRCLWLSALNWPVVYWFRDMGPGFLVLGAVQVRMGADEPAVGVPSAHQWRASIAASIK
mgnify:CR=1 FL=1